MSDERGPAHCPRCAVIEPAGGFDRDDPIGTNTITRFRCLDCQATFPWRCFPTDPECKHGPFQWAGERFTFYFGQGTRPEATRFASSRESSDKANADTTKTQTAYRADLDIASYDALEEFLTVTSDALISGQEAATIQSKLETKGGDIEWPCEIVLEFRHGEWASYSATHPDEATVLEPHLVSVGE